MRGRAAAIDRLITSSDQDIPGGMFRRARLRDRSAWARDIASRRKRNRVRDVSSLSLAAD